MKKEAVMSWLRSHEQEQIEFLQQMIRIPSVTGNEGPIQEFMAKTLTEMGLAVDSFVPSLEELQKHPAYVAPAQPYEGRPDVVGTLKGRGRRPVAAVQRPHRRYPRGLARQLAA